VEGGGGGVPHDVAEGVSLGERRGFVGSGAPRPERHRIAGGGRSPVAVWPQISDAGLSNRQRLQAAVVDRARANHQNLLAILPLVPAEAPREPNRAANSQAVGVAQVQPAERASSLAARRLPTILGVHWLDLGRPVLGPMVYPNAAIQTGTDEESGPHPASSSRTHPQLVSCQR